MSETVKLIIEIPKDAYRACRSLKTDNDQGILTFCIVNAVADGIPLDGNSEKAEVQAYFDGEAYGWEQGRKALIDDIKAEIEQNAYPIVHGVNNHEKGMTLYGILQVLDNIGKGVSE